MLQLVLFKKHRIVFFLFFIFVRRYARAHDLDNFDPRTKKVDVTISLLQFFLAVSLGFMGQVLVTAASPQKLVKNEPVMIQNFTLSQPIMECNQLLGTGGCRAQQYYQYQVLGDDSGLIAKKQRLYADIPMVVYKDQGLDQSYLVTYYTTYKYDWMRYFGLHNYRSGARKYEYHVPANWQP